MSRPRAESASDYATLLSSTAVPPAITSTGWKPSLSSNHASSYKSLHSLHTVHPNDSYSSNSDEEEGEEREGRGKTKVVPPVLTMPYVVGAGGLRAEGLGGTRIGRSRSSSSASTASSIQLRLGSGLGWGERWLGERPILSSLLRALLLFTFALLFLYTVLKALLPPIAEEDWEKVKIPKSFEGLKELNGVLQVYKTQHRLRVAGSYIVVYLFLQAFSIPGSMYLSILGGAMYGVLIALPLACFCVASGALLAYLLSSFLGPAILLNSETWQRRLGAWSERVKAHEKDLISYLIVLRIAPLPPHWFINVVAPHLGIGIWTFWISTFFGISGVTYIHTQIGTTLDQMTSSDDFHLISWQNGLGLGGIIVAVLIPVLLRRAWKQDLSEAATNDDLLPPPVVPSISVSIPSPYTQAPSSPTQSQASTSLYHSAYEVGDDDSDSEERESGRNGGISQVQTGDMSKASKVLGVDVDEAGWGGR